MCDYSLQQVKSRPAAVGDKLITTNFGTGTTGFADVNEADVAVCVLPGTEIAFDDPVTITVWAGCGATFEQTQHQLARFRQVDKDSPRTHHDTLEFPDGRTVQLTRLQANQRATVLQLPALPKTVAEVEEQKRAEFV
jgi:hypothetical protein